MRLFLGQLTALKKTAAEKKLACAFRYSSVNRPFSSCPILRFRASLHRGEGAQVGEVTRLGRITRAVHIIPHFNLIKFT